MAVDQRHARAALASGDLAVIIRTYRAATGVSQRRLAELLGYDPTYISMIETGRREISDVAARLRIARHLGLPAHTLGVSDPDDADFTAMLQFGESTIRLAAIARQSGHDAEAVNELWPLVTRLESRVADGHVERDVMLLLARAELGVSYLRERSTVVHGNPVPVASVVTQLITRPNHRC